MLNTANRLKKVKYKHKIDFITVYFSFSEVLITALVLVIMLLLIVNIKLPEHHRFSNVLVLEIEDVVVELIRIYLVDKVVWVYDFEDKVELEVCLAIND
jgi:hypothetical protein